MKLSIIIPVYNSSLIISKLVDDIKKEITKIQNISNYQIILVNLKMTQPKLNFKLWPCH